MLQLTEHKPGQHHYIRAVLNDGVIIDEQRHTSSVILGARLLKPDWPVHGMADLDASTIEPLLEHGPELVVIGCGTRPGFPDIAIQRLFLERGIGLECMSLNAACRTFNVLMSENRRAVAGLIISTST